jgi:hypothetical protein
MTKTDIELAKLKGRVDTTDVELRNVLSYVKSVDDKVTNIRDNHLHEIKAEVNDLKVAIKGLVVSMKGVKDGHTVAMKTVGDRIGRVETKVWFMVSTGILTLIGIVVNTYLTLK